MMLPADIRAPWNSSSGLVLDLGVHTEHYSVDASPLGAVDSKSKAAICLPEKLLAVACKIEGANTESVKVESML